MDVILVEAECKEQYEGQNWQKDNRNALYPRAKTIEPHRRNNSRHYTPIGRTKEPYAQGANRSADRFEIWHGKKAT